ncbi:aquaporin [Anopheles sinensis]|uniref:Aquaporin n=1 Tax=Anopheles sinensis TaxID=74873 RepID=A0A084WTQ8_ANOSI|nr:aquaporin [Anopheles sinensis]
MAGGTWEHTSETAGFGGGGGGGGGRFRVAVVFFPLPLVASSASSVRDGPRHRHTQAHTPSRASTDRPTDRPTDRWNRVARGHRRHRPSSKGGDITLRQTVTLDANGLSRSEDVQTPSSVRLSKTQRSPYTPHIVSETRAPTTHATRANRVVSLSGSFQRAGGFSCSRVRNTDWTGFFGHSDRVL